MQSEANQHGTETPDALPTSYKREEVSTMNQAQSSLVSGALGAAKKVTDVLDGTGTSTVADGGGVEAGTKAATQAYSTEEMGMGNEERPT